MICAWRDERRDDGFVALSLWFGEKLMHRKLNKKEASHLFAKRVHY